MSTSATVPVTGGAAREGRLRELRVSGRVNVRFEQGRHGRDKLHNVIALPPRKSAAVGATRAGESERRPIKF